MNDRNLRKPRDGIVKIICNRLINDDSPALETIADCNALDIHGIFHEKCPQSVICFNVLKVEDGSIYRLRDPKLYSYDKPLALESWQFSSDFDFFISMSPLGTRCIHRIMMLKYHLLPIWRERKEDLCMNNFKASMMCKQ